MFFFLYVCTYVEIPALRLRRIELLQLDNRTCFQYWDRGNFTGSFHHPPVYSPLPTSRIKVARNAGSPSFESGTQSVVYRHYRTADGWFGRWVHWVGGA